MHSISVQVQIPVSKPEVCSICCPDGLGSGEADEPLLGEALTRELCRDCDINQVMKELINEIIVGFNGDEDKATASEKPQGSRRTHIGIILGCQMTNSSIRTHPPTSFHVDSCLQ